MNKTVGVAQARYLTNTVSVVINKYVHWSSFSALETLKSSGMIVARVTRQKSQRFSKEPARSCLINYESLSRPWGILSVNTETFLKQISGKIFFLHELLRA